MKNQKKHQQKVRRQSNAESLRQTKGIALSPPPVATMGAPIQRQVGPENDGELVMEPEVVDTRTLKEKLQDVYTQKATVEGKEVERSPEASYDELAKYIATNTKGRRTTKHKYMTTADSFKLSGDKDAMEYLHEIGYWKDKSRRTVNAAKKLYDDWTLEKDADGNRTKALDEGDKAATEKIRELVSVTRPETAELKKDNELMAETEKENGVPKSKRHKFVGGQAGVVANAQKSKFAWSASTISRLHHMAGSGDTFKYADGHVVYARDGKSNMRKDDIEGLEKLHPALGKKAATVDIGDTLHRGRKTKSTYDSIKSTTHSDIVVDMPVYKILQKDQADTIDEKTGEILKKGLKKGDYERQFDYEKMKENFELAQEADPDLTLDKYVGDNGYKIFAEVIGGNTSDYSAPGKKIAGADTLGKNFVPLNADRTIKAKTGNNGGRYKSTNAYFGVQKTDYRTPEEETKASSSPPVAK